MTAGVVALLADRAAEPDLAAAFEEEGVPLSVEEKTGEAVALARKAAGSSPLGMGVGGDADALVLLLAAASGWPYLQAHPRDARAFGHAVARIAARRPL